MVSIFMPALAEELWSQMGNKKSIFFEKWPEYDLKLIIDDHFELVVQINGKVRDKMQVAMDISENEAKELALTSEKTGKWIEGRKIKKVVFIKNRLINFII
jgi:leucyl-tRNA synthetase